MASINPPKDYSSPSAQISFSTNPVIPPVKPELPTDPTSRPPSSTDADIAHVPSYSRWFSWKDIHECEVRFLPEFFDSRSHSKNPSVYKYYRNSIVKRFRENPSKRITFTEIRKTIVGDVRSIRRVFDFLDAWGLINYSVTNKALKWDEKESKGTTGGALQGGSEVGGTAIDASGSKKDVSSRICSGCKSVCSIACFVCDKYDLTLCARCYVRGNYRVGVSSSEFRRVEISETKTAWTEKETLLLLEGVMHYGDDWKKVAQHVNVRSEKECVAHFLTLPFGEEFICRPSPTDIDSKYNQVKDTNGSEHDLESSGKELQSKRMRLTPLADASNPIMAQAAFLSTLAGVEVAESAARAACTALSEVGHTSSRETLALKRQPEGDTMQNTVEESVDKELELEQAISEITRVQMKEIRDKILHFEELDLHIEKDWQQIEQMKSLLFIDQLTLLFHKSSAAKTEGAVEESARTG